MLFHYSERKIKGRYAPANYLPMMIMIGSYTRQQIYRYKLQHALIFFQWVYGGIMRAIRELTQQDGWKTQHGMMTKKCRVR